MNMKTNRKNAEWLRNKNQRKNPKVFSANFIQNPDGSFFMIGGQTKVLVRKNQHSQEYQNVDTRDFAKELRNNRIVTL